MEARLMCIILSLILECFVNLTDCNVRYQIIEMAEVPYGQHIGSHTARSILDCFMSCSKLGTCRSVMYKVTSQVCSLNSEPVQSAFITNPPGQPIVKYGTKASPCPTTMRDSCTTNADCIDDASTCDGGICKCEIGLSYRPSTCSCENGCSKYGQSFQEFQNIQMLNLNKKSVLGTSKDECLQLCIDETDFECRLFEYWSMLAVKECQLQYEYFGDHLNIIDPFSTIYIRDCDFD